MKCVSNHQDLCSNLPNMGNFHPLEVLGRGSETQLQAVENFNELT